MVGLGAGIDGRNRDAVGMMALHDALRNVCFDFDWTYSVFWTIRPRPRCRGGTACKLGDDNGSLMLMWEDGFCRPRTRYCFEDIDGDDAVRKAFSKMSIQLYNYGEGLMGKVASDKCHKWVFKEPSEFQLNISNYWQSSVDALPPEWTDQFASGIQTIAVIQAGHGLLQLGSCSIIPEDLHFVLRMRHVFESLVSQSGFLLSQFFSSKRSIPQSPSPPPPKQTPVRPPQPLLNWSGAQFPAALPNIQHSARVDFSATIKDDTHLLVHPNSDPTTSHVEEMVPAKHGGDFKWPNDVSFFDGVAGWPDEAKVPFSGDDLRSKLVPAGKRGCSTGRGEGEDGRVDGGAEGYFSLEKESNKGWKVG